MTLRERLTGARRPETQVPTADRWLVVGLRNPEREYGQTRHNLGAEVVRLLAGRLGASLKAAPKLRAETADTFEAPGGTPITLVLPGGYMNSSGGPVQSAANFYKVPRERIVVVHDDLDLPNAALRVKQGGGAAGHNGLKDVTSRLGGPDYHRVRIGIGRPPGRQDPADYVLRRLPPADREQVDVTLELAADAVLSLIRDGLEPTQNLYNAR